MPANRVLLKNSSLVGVFWGAYATQKPQVMAKSFTTLLKWAGEGSLKPHVSATFPLAQAAEALTHVMNRKVLGKVAVTMG